MTDFFAELEGHLHGAARRRARRRKPQLVLAVATAAVTVAVVFGALAAVDTARDPEVAAPPPPGPCSTAPQAVIERFEVFRVPPADYERVPGSVVERMSTELPGGRRASRLFPAAGRLALRDDGRDFWLVPAYLDPGCTEPGLCWNVILPDADLVDCRRLRELRNPYEMARDEGPKPWIAALVPDGVEVTVDGLREGGSLEQVHSVLLADTEPGREPRLVRHAGVTPLPGCDPLFSEDPVPAAVRERFPQFAASGERVRTEVWARALGGSGSGEIHDANGRVLLREAGVRVSGVPASAVDCDRPGVCLIAEYDDGRPTEYLRRCWTLEDIAAGPPAAAFGVDDERVLVLAPAPAGTTAAVWGGRPMTVENGVASLVARPPVEPDVQVNLRR